MKAEDFQGIVAGLEDAIAFVKGDGSRGREAGYCDDRAANERDGDDDA